MGTLEAIPAQDAQEVVAKINGRGRCPRKNKFNAIKTIIGEHRFDSKKEAQCWQFLKARERAGEIEKLERQVKYELFAFMPDGAGKKICTYIADFRYFDNKLGRQIVADAKGVRTALFKLKAKLMLANHGIDIELM